MCHCYLFMAGVKLAVMAFLLKQALDYITLHLKEGFIQSDLQ